MVRDEQINQQLEYGESQTAAYGSQQTEAQRQGEKRGRQGNQDSKYITATHQELQTLQPLY